MRTWRDKRGASSRIVKAVGAKARSAEAGIKQGDCPCVAGRTELGRWRSKALFCASSAWVRTCVKRYGSSGNAIGAGLLRRKCLFASRQARATAPVGRDRTKAYAELAVHSRQAVSGRGWFPVARGRLGTRRLAFVCAGNDRAASRLPETIESGMIACGQPVTDRMQASPGQKRVVDSCRIYRRIPA